jgi:hypothetical protein
MSRVGLFQPRILKDRRERRTTAVRERRRVCHSGSSAEQRDQDADATHTLRQRVRQRAITRPLVLRGREEICNSLIMSGAP